MRKSMMLAGVVLVIGALVALWPAVPAQEVKPAPKPVAVNEPLTEMKIVQRVQAATDKALAYLASKQNADGSWSTTNDAPNALALLAFLGRGHVPGRGPYRDVIEKAKKYIVATAQPTGLLSLGARAMYEHGLATLALAELYGMDPDPLLEDRLRKAVDLIVKTQSPAGGWRYSPAPVDQDLSVSVMQIVALRAANNADIPLPAQTIEKAIKYVRSCGAPTGGYGYTGPGAGPQTSAAGVLSLQLLGKHDDPNIPKSLTYLSSIPIVWGAGGVQYFYYFHYYAVQAFYQAGGKEWNEWHPKIRELLLQKQNADGSFDVPPGTAEAGIDPKKIYSTAMACLVLDIYQHFLPAYQR